MWPAGCGLDSPARERILPRGMGGEHTFRASVPEPAPGLQIGRSPFCVTVRKGRAWSVVIPNPPRGWLGSRVSEEGWAAAFKQNPERNPSLVVLFWLKKQVG